MTLRKHHRRFGIWNLARPRTVETYPVADGRVECYCATVVTLEPQRVRLVRKVETQRAQCFSFEHSAYAYDEPKTVSHPPASSLKKQVRRAFQKGRHEKPFATSWFPLP
jgi:hypothetical protein